MSSNPGRKAQPSPPMSQPDPKAERTVECPECNGSRFTYTGRRCLICDGTGRVSAKRGW